MGVEEEGDMEIAAAEEEEAMMIVAATAEAEDTEIAAEEAATTIAVQEAMVIAVEEELLMMIVVLEVMVEVTVVTMTAVLDPMEDQVAVLVDMIGIKPNLNFLFILHFIHYNPATCCSFLAMIC